ncbi:hypothetical protein Hdeb2414_s0030g00708911 [Helianthus debilis subsp. tardiflorus]
MNVGAKAEIEADVLVTVEEEINDNSDVEYRNPPSVTILEPEARVEEEATEDVEQESRKKPRTEPEPDTHQEGISVDPEPIIQTDPKITIVAQDTSTPDVFDFDLQETTTRLQPKRSSGVQFDVGSSSGASVSEHNEAAMRVTAEKMKFIEQADSDEEMDVDVAKLQRRVIILEQYVALKEAQIPSLQAQVSSKDQTIEQLQGDVNFLMSMVYDLKPKLEKKFRREFADKDDDPSNVAQYEQTTEERAAADEEYEADLNAYLAAEHKKKRKLPAKKQSNKQMLVLKNQDVNPLDEKFQLKDPTKKYDRYIMELGLSHYYKVGNKSKVASWRFDYDKDLWLITRESGHMEYYTKELQFESWTKIDL